MERRGVVFQDSPAVDKYRDRDFDLFPQPDALNTLDPYSEFSKFIRFVGDELCVVIQLVTQCTPAMNHAWNIIRRNSWKMSYEGPQKTVLKYGVVRLATRGSVYTIAKQIIPIATALLEDQTMSLDLCVIFYMCIYIQLILSIGNKQS